MTMRRRQEAADDTDNIVVEIPDVDSSGKNKKPKRSYSLTVIFGVIANISIYLLLKFRNHPSTSIDLNSIEGHAENITLASNSSNSAAAVDMPQELPYNLPRIPRRLIFTYKSNLISPTRDTDPPFNATDPLTVNVLRTISAYKALWEGVDNAQSKKYPQEEIEKEKVVTAFLSDWDCIGVIAKADQRLVKHFNQERRGEIKADICRAAELYLNGGYYFDIDTGVIEPLNFDTFGIPSSIPDPLYLLKELKKGNSRPKPSKDDIVTFATVYNDMGRFDEVFTAAMPGHPVLKKSLDYMVAYYEGTLSKVLPQFILDEQKADKHQIPSIREPGMFSPGPYTVLLAYQATTEEEWEQYVSLVMKKRGYPREEKKSFVALPANRRYSRFLYSISLLDDEVKQLNFFGELPIRGVGGTGRYAKRLAWCNYICFSGKDAFFYSRTLASKVCRPLLERTSDNNGWGNGKPLKWV